MFSPGGGTDTSARTFLPYFTKYTPGNPKFVVRNMPGAGGRKAWNFCADKAKPDGLTLIWSPWDPIGKGTGDKGLKAGYTKLQLVGGAYSPLLNYIRTV